MHMLNKPCKVYIAYRYSCNFPPFNSDVLAILGSIGKATRVGLELAKLGFIPFIPHLDFLVAIMDGSLIDDKFPLTKDYYYKSSMEWLKCCDAMLLVDSMDIKRGSKGVKVEYEYCIDVGIPIFTSIEELLQNKEAKRLKY